MSLYSVLIEQPTVWWLWIALAVYGMLWAPLLLWFGLRSGNPARATVRSVYATACWHGFFIAAVNVSLVPSALLLTSLAAESYGGLRVYFKALLAVGVGFLLGVMTLDFRFQPESSLWTMIASIPALVVFPLVFGLTNYDLRKRLLARTEEAIKLSRIDGLTGIMNRDFLENRMILEFQRCKRGGQPACFVLIDIDFFKKINDEHGHLTGDAVLRRVANVLKNKIRDVDYVGRYGGEEFGLCLINTQQEVAGMVVERLRKAVEEACRNDRSISCTLSCGIAEYRASYETYKDWFQKADEALYRAKANGRDRIELATFE